MLKESSTHEIKKKLQIFSFNTDNKKKKEAPLPGKKITLIWPVWLFVFSKANCSGNEWPFYIELESESEPPFYKKKKNATSLKVKFVQILDTKLEKFFFPDKLELV